MTYMLVKIDQEMEPTTRTLTFWPYLLWNEQQNKWSGHIGKTILKIDSRLVSKILALKANAKGSIDKHSVLNEYLQIDEKNGEIVDVKPLCAPDITNIPSPQ